MQYGFGVDLGGTTVKIAYFDQLGNMLDKWEIPTVTANEGQQILPDIAASISDYIAAHEIDRATIIGIGIGVPGPVSNAGVVNRCINLGWGVFNVQDRLKELTGFPVEAGNDATVAALGECWKGGGQGSQNMLFVTLGTGVGGGIVVEGQVIHGAHGAGGEIGHMTINKAETEICTCGKYGCVEQYCSATGVVRLAHRTMRASQKPSVLRQDDCITCKDVFDAAKAGDELAQDVLDQFFAYLGEFLGNVCSVVNPEVVVLGGGVSRAGQVLLEGVRPYFDQYVFHAAKNVRFELAVLGNDAGAYGAFKLALDAFTHL